MSARKQSDVALIGILALVLLLLAVLSLCLGRVNGAYWSPFWLEGSQESLIFIELRLPRTALAVLVGMVLGLSGAVLQGLLRNPLAEPGVIGTGASAALGAVLALYFGLASISLIFVPLCGILAAVFSLLVLFAVAGRAASIATLILAGVAINSLAGALTALALNLAPNPFASVEMMFWLLGSVADRSLDQLYLCLPFVVVGALLLFRSARSLSALALGEQTAASLGVNMQRLNLQVLIGTGLAVGACVATVGNIGFVGLVVPHLIRPLVQHDPARLLWPSMLGGGILLLLADMLVRMLPAGSELKLGVLTALLGAPFFLVMIMSLSKKVRL